jgi:hypothetical protein
VDPSGDVLIEVPRRDGWGAVKLPLEARDWPEELKAVARMLGRARADFRCVAVRVRLPSSRPCIGMANEE